MKYYYNGILIRTSKTHDYRYAVVGELKDGKYDSLGCRSKKEDAEELLNSKIRKSANNITTYQDHIKAIENGESGWTSTFKGRKYYHRFTADDTVEKYERWIAIEEEQIRHTIETYKVVELERIG